MPSVLGTFSFEADGSSSVSFSAVLSCAGICETGGQASIAFTGNLVATPNGNPGTVINLNSETPAPLAGDQNILWQADNSNPRNVSA